MSAAARIRVAKAQLLQLRRDRDDDVAEARGSVKTMIVDGMVTDAETQTMNERQIDVQRDRLEAGVVEQYASKFTALEASIREDAEHLANVADDARPQLGDDARSWSRMERAWDGVKARLEAGTPLSVILRDADEHAVHAAAEWAPDYLRAQHEATQGQHGFAGLQLDGAAGRGQTRLVRQPFDVDGIRHAVDARLGELVEGYGQARADAVEAESVVAYVSPLVDGLTDTSGGPQPTGLAASIGAHYAEQAVHATHGIEAGDLGSDGDGDAGVEGAA